MIAAALNRTPRVLLDALESGKEMAEVARQLGRTQSAVLSMRYMPEEE